MVANLLKLPLVRVPHFEGLTELEVATLIAPYQHVFLIDGVWKMQRTAAAMIVNGYQKIKGLNS